jgi:release factor H-coupled RctB family protein
MSRATIRIIASSESWIDQTAIDQLDQSAILEGMDEIVGLPDLHAGRGIAVGAAFWSRSHVHPHLVGSDIGCGMALWQSATPVRKFRLDAADRKLRGLDEPWSGDYAARLVEAGLPPDLMGEKLGSIGGGNHFAELLCVDSVHDEARSAALGLEKANVLLMVHSGSRGLGQAILERHRSHHCERGLEADTRACASYLEAHDGAVDWAILNREIIAARFLGRLGMKAKRLIDICHNNVVPHRGGWLHRKGAAPADKGPVVVPGSRGELTYVVQPRLDRADRALHSLAHGAGRKWSRSEARGKLERRFTVAELERTAIGSRVICEDRDLIYEEAPHAYKDIHRVIRDLRDAGLVDPVATLRPLITYKTRRS